MCLEQWDVVAAVHTRGKQQEEAFSGLFLEPSGTSTRNTSDMTLDMCVLAVTCYDSNHDFIKWSLRKIKLDLTAAIVTRANTLRDLLHYLGIKRPPPPVIIRF